jgi:hypothetical protein
MDSGYKVTDSALLFLVKSKAYTFATFGIRITNIFTSEDKSDFKPRSATVGIRQMTFKSLVACTIMSFARFSVDQLRNGKQKDVTVAKRIPFIYEITYLVNRAE